MKPSTISKNTGSSAAMTTAIAQRVPAQLRQPVQRALQDEDRGMLVDHLGAAGAGDVHADQFALDGRGRQPLVPQRDGKAGEVGEIAGKGAGRLRARPLAAVHVDGQSEHEADRVAFARYRQQPRRVGLERLAVERFDAGRQPAVGIGDGDADGLGAEIEADRAPRSGQCVTASIRGRMGAGMAPHNTGAASWRKADHGVASMRERHAICRYRLTGSRPG